MSDSVALVGLPKELLASVVDPSALQQLEERFQTFLASLSTGMGGLDHFRLEFEKLFRVLKKSHESEKRLSRKSRTLQQEILTNELKIAQVRQTVAEEQSQVDQARNRLATLRTDLEKAQAQEAVTKEEFARLKEEMGDVQTAIAKKKDAIAASEAQLTDLTALGATAAQTLDILRATARQSEAAAAGTQTQLETLQSAHSQNGGEIVTLQKALDSVSGRHDHSVRRKQQLEGETSRLDKEIEDNQTLLDQALAEAGVKHKLATEAEQQAKEERRTVEKLESGIATLKRDLATARETQTALEGQKTALAKTERELDARTTHVSSEIRHVQSEIGKTNKAIEHLKTLRASETDALNGINASIEDREKQLARILHSLDSLQAAKNAEQAAFVEAVLGRDALHARLVQYNTQSKQILEKNVLSEAHLADFVTQEAELVKKRGELAKQVDSLSREKSQFGKFISERNATYAKLLDTIQDKELVIHDLAKQQAEGTTLLKRLKPEYEEKRLEKNETGKDLNANQETIAEMKRNFKILAQTIDHLKTEIKQKEHALQKETHEKNKFFVLFTQSKDKLTDVKSSLHAANGDVRDQKAQLQRLDDLIKQTEHKRAFNQRHYDHLIAERDILATQLIRRNDELALLYEKSTLQARTLQDAETMFAERADQLRALKTRSAIADRTIATANLAAAGPSSGVVGGGGASTVAGGIPEMRRSLFKVQRDLLGERARVAELSKAIEDPENTDRWREIESKNSTKLDLKDLLAKVNVFQRRLIRKIETAVTFGLEIKDRRNELEDLQIFLGKQGKFEQVAETGRLRETAAAKTKKTKALAAEVNANQSTFTESRAQIESLQKEIMNAKRMYFDQKRREKLQELASTSQVISQQQSYQDI